MNHSSEFTALCDAYREQIDELSVEQLQALRSQQASFHLVDVREKEEYEQGAIPGALHLSKGWIEAKICQTIPNKHEQLILYCGGGNRSVLAAVNLKLMGYDNVWSLIGGYKGWKSHQN